MDWGILRRHRWERKHPEQKSAKAAYHGQIIACEAQEPAPDSCLMQDEPERGAGFSHKMSLKGKIGMLGIDHQHGRFRSREPGADPGVSGGQRRGAVCRAAARGGVRLGGADAGAASVRQPGPVGKGFSAEVYRPDDGPEPGAGDATDQGVCQDRAGESGGLSTQQVRHALHHSRCGSVGLRRQGAWEPERAGDAAHPGARVQRIQPGCLPAAGGNFGGAPVPLAQLGGYRKRNTSYQPTRPTPIPIGERRKPQPQGRPDICASTPCIRAIRTDAKGCITSTPSTR